MNKPIPTVKCPKCNGDVTYNGNYYCMDEDGCGWVLPHPTPPRLRQWYAVAYVRYMEQTGREPRADVLRSILQTGD